MKDEVKERPGAFESIGCACLLVPRKPLGGLDADVLAICGVHDTRRHILSLMPPIHEKLQGIHTDSLPDELPPKGSALSVLLLRMTCVLASASAV